MANINLSQTNFVDYVASLYFNALNCADVKFTKKIATVAGEDTPLIHIEGVQKNSGVVINVDLFPRNHATAEDLAAMPEKLDDIQFRVGYYAEIDAEGNKVLREGKPKWTKYVTSGKTVVLSGDKREFGE